jgi:hypothetical protein
MSKDLESQLNQLKIILVIAVTVVITVAIISVGKQAIRMCNRWLKIRQRTKDLLEYQVQRSQLDSTSAGAPLYRVASPAHAGVYAGTQGAFEPSDCASRGDRAYHLAGAHYDSEYESPESGDV